MLSESLSDRFRRQTIQPEEAQQLLLDHIRSLGSESIPLNEAWGRTLAEALDAPHPYPPFRRSGMDGYALRAADLAEAAPDRPVTLAVLESLPSGVEPLHKIGPGQASRIMTGGMVPEDADAVVMLEATKAERPNEVQIGKPIAAGLNIADIGCEIADGERLLSAGQRIGAGESALLAAFGHATVAVAAKPRVAILSTGSELLEPHEPLVPAKIRNSNLPMLIALVREAGAEPIVLGKVPDDRDRASEIVREALAQCDLLVSTGGVSVGDYDVMVDVLAASDVNLLFNKIAMRPGSPTTAAIVAGKPLVALSGNPGACFVGFQLFALPAIKRMLGASTPYAASFQAHLGVSFPKVNAYRRYIRGCTRIENGRVYVDPTGDDKSSLMKTIVGADCLIEIPATKTGIEAGELVTAWRLG